MKTHTRLSLFILIAFLLSLVGVPLSQASPSEAPDSLEDAALRHPKLLWQSQYIHQVANPEDVGTHVSLALRPFDDIPYISYYDAYNGDLMLAHYLPGGAGNCPPNLVDWKCEVIDGDGGDNVGVYSSLGFWADEADHAWTIGISYRDSTNNALKYTTWVCYELYCTIPATVTISKTYIPAYTGLFTSFHFSPDGIPHIAYFSSFQLGNDALNLAYYVGSGGNCGEGSAAGKWACEVIDSGPSMGMYPSLDFSAHDQIKIAYYDGGNQWLKVAEKSQNGDCGDDLSWDCETIDHGEPDSADVGKYVAYVANYPAYGPQRFAYYDATHATLKYYGEDLSFDPVEVDLMGTSPDLPMDISMAIDRDGYPIIAYQKIKDFTRRLYIARPYFVYDDGLYGNCGFMFAGQYQYWRCTPLDLGGQYLQEAEYISLAVSSAGLAQIAYSEYYYQYPQDAAHSLKFTSQSFWSFLAVLSKD